MKNWVKAVLWVIVGFCLLSAVAGIFSMFSFLQSLEKPIYTIGISDEVKPIFKASAAAQVVCAIFCVALIAATIFCHAKGSKKTNTIRCVLILTFVISVFFIIYSFCTYYISIDVSSYTGDRIDYAEFYHYQLYLSAALSTFVPLLIAAGVELGYFIYNKKKQKAIQPIEPTEVADPEQND